MDNRRNEPNLKLINMEQVEVEQIDWLIYQTAEDGLGDTIKPRLLAAGADCSRVMVIDEKISLCDCSDWSYE